MSTNEAETIDVSQATEQELIWACPKVHDADMLKALQSLPLEAKIEATKIRIAEFIAHYNGNVYISFSGGKDSTVLAHIVHVLMGRTDIPLVFSNTGLEYSQIQRFARKKGATFIRPEMQFTEVISTYGYPIISKEVAEAIYYARRIRSQNVNVEREPEQRSKWRTVQRKRSEPTGTRIDETRSELAEYLRESTARTERIYQSQRNSGGAGKNCSRRLLQGTYPNHLNRNTMELCGGRNLPQTERPHGTLAVQERRETTRQRTALSGQ